MRFCCTRWSLPTFGSVGVNRSFMEIHFEPTWITGYYNVIWHKDKSFLCQNNTCNKVCDADDMIYQGLQLQTIIYTIDTPVTEGASCSTRSVSLEGFMFYRKNKGARMTEWRFFIWDTALCSKSKYWTVFQFRRAFPFPNKTPEPFTISQKNELL